MRPKLTRVAIVGAAFAAATVGLITTSASALPAGTASAGPVTMTPVTGNSATASTVLAPSGAFCPGDSATGQYRWQTFLVSAGIDPATLTYDSLGPVLPAGSPAAAVAYSLFSTGGTPQVNENTAVGTGVIVGQVTTDLAAFTPDLLPVGGYTIGYACSRLGETFKFWSSPLTLTADAANGGPAERDYAFGVPATVPAAPVLAAALTAGDGTLGGTFTEAAGSPAVTGYTVTAVPTTGTTITVTLPATATSFSLTGLTNGTAYAVTLTATNSVGNSAASNSVSGTPVIAARPPVTNLSAAPAPSSAILSWTAPTGPAPTGYTIAVSPTVTGAPFTAAAGATTFTVPGLTAGTNYTFSVTPTHTTPFVASPASVTFAAVGNAVIIQDITASRPNGALVLTQKCGAYGALAAEAASPGFDGGLAALPAAGPGTAPTLTAGGSVTDPQFPNYPGPATPTYPTHCGVDLGTGTYLTTGPLAGQYYATSGRINQVTVSDSRDLDAGWTVNGAMSDFTVSGGGASFSGNNLGWTPVVSSATATQAVTAGPVVQPTAPGLGTAKVLASATSGHGLGVASFDARLKLLIPVSARSGTYTGALTFTVV